MQPGPLPAPDEFARSEASYAVLDASGLEPPPVDELASLSAVVERQSHPWSLRVRLNGQVFALRFSPLPRLLDLDAVAGDAPISHLECDAAGWLNPTASYELKGVVGYTLFALRAPRPDMRMLKLSSLVIHPSLFRVNRFSHPMLESVILWNVFGPLNDGLSLEGLALRVLGVLYQNISRDKFPPFHDSSSVSIPESAYATLQDLHIRKCPSFFAGLDVLPRLQALRSLTVVKCGVANVPLHVGSLTLLGKVVLDGNLLTLLPLWLGLLLARPEVATVSYGNNPLRRRLSREPHALPPFDGAHLPPWHQCCFACGQGATVLGLLYRNADPFVVSYCPECAAQGPKLAKCKALPAAGVWAVDAAVWDARARSMPL